MKRAPPSVTVDAQGGTDATGLPSSFSPMLSASASQLPPAIISQSPMDGPKYDRAAGRTAHPRA